MKALITYFDGEIDKREELKLPVIAKYNTPHEQWFLKKDNESFIFCHEIRAIDAAPEEEYFLMNDGAGQEYLIPESLKEAFQSTLDWHKQEQEKQGRYLKVRYYLEDYVQYKKKEDWEKEYKITKR